MKQFITTTDTRRLARWQHLFGLDRLPVLSRWTRFDFVDGFEAPCYDLALGELTQLQRDRLACYASRRTGRLYADVRAEINAAVSWPVKAAGCTVVEDEATVVRPSPLFVLAQRLFAREQSVRALQAR